MLGGKVLRICKSKPTFISILVLGVLVIVYQLSYTSSLFRKQALRRIDKITNADSALLHKGSDGSEQSEKSIEVFTYSEGAQLQKGSEGDELPQSEKTIAIGLAITAYTGIESELYLKTADKMLFMKHLLPSFCETCSREYQYDFYLGYDNNDTYFNNSDNRAEFIAFGYGIINQKCTNASQYSIHFVRCEYSRSPAWAQNDAMYEAYLDGADYFYRINDDAILETAGWTEAFINILRGYDPPNVGVVGPDVGDSWATFLMFEFTHRTHIDMFGWYYPRAYHMWFADAWISDIYKDEWFTQTEDITLEHTKVYRIRYITYAGDTSLDRRRNQRPLLEGKTWIKRYVTYKRNHTDVRQESRVISISLFGNSSQYLIGAIRNAQLAPVVFPGWLLRVYVPSRHVSDEVIPKRILVKLKELGAQVYIVPASITLPDPRYMRYLVADDPSVDVFIIRDADMRLSDRQNGMIDNWLSSKQSFHFINDHPKYFSRQIPEGLWGARRAGLLRNLLNHTNMEAVLRTAQHSDILNQVIWPALKGDALCHRYVPVDKNKMVNDKRDGLFPCEPVLPEGVGDPRPPGKRRCVYVGDKYNRHDQSVSKDESKIICGQRFRFLNSGKVVIIQ